MKLNTVEMEPVPQARRDLPATDLWAYTIQAATELAQVLAWMDKAGPLVEL